VLLRLGTLRARGAFRKLLSDPSSAVRTRALKMWRRYPIAELVSALVRRLDDPVTSIRLLAADRLVTSKEPSVLVEVTRFKKLATRAQRRMLERASLRRLSP
jgi:hypothetical protein